MSLPLGAPRSASCKWGAATTKYTAQPYGTFSIPLSTSLDSEQILSLLLRRKQLSIHTTLIPIYSKSSDRAAWLTGYSVQVATTGLNKLSRQLVVKRLGCQDIRSSKHNYSVGKARSFVAVPTHTQVSQFGNGMAPWAHFRKVYAPPEWHGSLGGGWYSRLAYPISRTGGILVMIESHS